MYTESRDGKMSSVIEFPLPKLKNNDDIAEFLKLLRRTRIDPEKIEEIDKRITRAPQTQYHCYTPKKRQKEEKMEKL